MTENLKVKILKKTKDAPYPEHIIVDRKDSSEGAHLYFDQGNLKKVVYIKKDNSPALLRWDPHRKKYFPEPAPYRVKAAYNVHKNHYYPILSPNRNEGLIPTSFCSFRTSNHWKEFIITFLEPKGNRFAVVLDLDGKCKPNQYTESWNADVKTIYPHQPRRTCPIPSIIKKERT